MNRLHKIVAAVSLVLFATSAHAGWQQTFVDDFNGTSLDTSKWTYTNYWGQQTRMETGEVQCYVPDLVSVGSGSVALTAVNQLPSSCNPDPGYLTHQSGMISTGTSFRQIYGYFEVRAKMPKGKGLWPQFRLSQFGGPFPPVPPEIVGAETYGSTSQVRQSYIDYDPSTGVSTTYPTVTNADASAGFNTYGVDWQPNLVIFYFNGVEVGRRADANIYSQPLYMQLNLAVGGDAGAPDASTVFPAKMEIDYVKAYARVNDGQPDSLPPGVSTAPSDTTPPKIAIIIPTKDITVKRKATIILAAVATDNKKVVSVVFKANGVQVCSSKNLPGEICTWTVPAATNVSSYTIQAIAKDAAGNSATDQVIVKAK